jgi:oxygen-independent coproporphyrinogen-3 oxidase
VDSIYLGGGTPAVLSPALVHQLSSVLRQEFSISPDAEITLESAPGQLEDASFEAMLSLGVNRMSFGVQSLVDQEARATGRSHTRAVVAGELARVRSAGVNNLSIDLIAGLPHQTAQSWQESLEVLVATGVDHASVYMLEIDDDSRLGRELLAGGSRYGAGTVPSEELMAEFYERAIAFLQQNGLQQYEISNFARAGTRSRHNLKYWRRQPYLGFGLDAHSMVRTQRGSALRFCNSAVLAEYVGGLEIPEPLEPLAISDEMEEAWFLGLRLNDGVAWQALAEEFGSDRVEAFRPVVSELADLGLISDEAGAVRLTRRGVLLSNEVFARFLAEKESAEQDLLIQVQ